MSNPYDPDIRFVDNPDPDLDEHIERLVQAVGPSAIIDGKLPTPVPDPRRDYLRCVGYLRVKKAAGWERGTGTIIATEDGYGILTAAHVVYDEVKRAPATEAQFFPARTGSVMPYGQIDIPRTRIKIADGYPSGLAEGVPDPRDYAVIRLGSLVDQRLAPFPRLKRVAADQVRKVQVTGYPAGLEPPASQPAMYLSQGDARSEVDGYRGFLFYKASTLHGSSGSGVVPLADDGSAELKDIVAVHFRRFKSRGSNTYDYNVGIHLTEAVIAWIHRQIRES